MMVPINEASMKPIMYSFFSDRLDHIYIVEDKDIMVYSAVSNTLKYKLTYISKDEITFLSMDS